MKPDTEPSEQERNLSAEAIKKLLADTYTLYLKTHGYHWNVEGPRFSELHTMFETQYRELWQAVDEIAERLRALGIYAPTSYHDFIEMTDIKTDNDVPSAEQMLQNLAKDHQILSRTARGVLRVAEKLGDDVTADIAIVH